MATQRIVKVLSAFIWLGFLFWSGCANFLIPEIGVTARQDARFALSQDGVQNGALNTGDLGMTFSYAASGNTFNLSGELFFSSSLTNTFPMKKSFFLKMSFLDDQGKVLETVDITPMISFFNHVPDEVPIKASCTKPAGAEAIAFNYFGVFRGGGDTDDGAQSDWNIFYFPFD